MATATYEMPKVLTASQAFPIPTSKIYVRSTGNDTTGNGTLATPYLTPDRALKDVPTVTNGVAYIIDMTGYGTYTPLTALPVYQIFGGVNPVDSALTDSILGSIFLADVTFYAEPSIILTVAAPYTTSSDPVSTLVSITKTGAGWTANQWQGKVVVSVADGLGGVVISNTSDTLVTTLGTAPTGTVTVLTNTAALNFVNSSGAFNPFNTTNFGLGYSVAFNGFDFTGPASVTDLFATSQFSSMAISGCTAVNTSISFTGITGFVFASYFTSSFNFTINTFKEFFLFNSAIVGAGTHTQIGNNTGKLLISNCYIDGTDSVSLGVYHGFDGVPRGTGDINNSWINNMTVPGVWIANTRMNHMTSVKLTNCSGGAIYISRGGQLVCDEGTIGGTGNAFGLEVVEGGQAFINNNGTMTVTGTVELKVGTLPATTWANFLALGNIVDRYGDLAQIVLQSNISTNSSFDFPTELVTANGAIDQFALIKASSAVAGRYEMLLAGDDPNQGIGVAMTAAAGAGSNFIANFIKGGTVTLLSDGFAVINVGDRIMPSTTADGRVRSGAGTVIRTAISAAGAVLNATVKVR